MKYQCVITICCGEGHRQVGETVGGTYKDINKAFKEAETYNSYAPACVCRCEVMEAEDNAL